MRHVAIAAIALMWAGIAVRADTTTDLDHIQGGWDVVSLVEEGKAIPAEETKALQVTVKGARLTIAKDGKVASDYTIKLDPTQMPKTLDMTITEGNDKGKVAPGIYTVNGDTLKICVDEDLKARPASFDAKDTKTCSVITLKRKKE
jgi:uncharacterized protein (TIGR03067 family)